MTKMKFYIAALLSLLLFSCTQKNGNKQYSGEVAAWVDTIPVTMAQVDNPIRQELFDELNRIYTIRNISLQELIDEKLLALEAAKYNITVGALKDSLVERHLKSNRLQQFISDNRYNDGIIVLERSLSSLDIESAKGNAVLMERFKDYVVSGKNCRVRRRPCRHAPPKPAKLSNSTCPKPSGASSASTTSANG